jgi:uncharacterized membrane protein
MSPSGRAAGDRHLEAVIGRVLRTGILASSVCLAAGLVLSPASNSPGLAGTLLTAGLVTLLATPAARVFVSIVAYARERDWLFVLLTLTVFAELILSVVAATMSRFR